ncbi:MAG TPA: DUF1800 domain-containing protein [Burkholderiaceae bacterium]
MNWRNRLLVIVAALSCLPAAQAAEVTDQQRTEQQRALHVLNRLGFGPRPGDIETVMAIGVDHYIDLQLNPQSIRLPNELLDRLDTLTSQDMPTGDLLAEYVALNKAAKDGNEEAKKKRKEAFQLIAEQTDEGRLARAVFSPAQLEEVMVDFWYNHFNVFAGKGMDRALVSSYERDAIRPYVLGHFRELLGATAKHPAMLFYLDNWQSVAPGFQPPHRFGAEPKVKASGLNENYARELMELHTLGVDAGYTQRDVTELARILTGWTFEPQKMMQGGETFTFAPRRHDSGDKDWLGKHIGGRGQQEGEWALDVLAAHPATAHHISYELAQYFVNDNPPPALVEKMSKRFIETQGDIREVLRTLFASREFWDPAQFDSKFKTPYQYVISTARASGLPINNIRPLLKVLNQLGMPLYGCQTPDGYKNTEEAWLNPDGLTRRINFATAFAMGKLPLGRNADAAQNDMPGGQMSGKKIAQMADAVDDGKHAPPVNAQSLLATLGPTISAPTRETIQQSAPGLRAAMVLGSPDFMRH